MNDRVKKLIFYAYLPLFSLLLFISLEIQNYQDATRSWLVFAASFALIFLALLVLFAITDNIFISGLLISFVLLLFYTVNFYRKLQTGQVLIPTDLNLARHIRSLTAFSDISIRWQPVCSVLIVAVLNVPLFFASKRIRLCVKNRAVTFAVSGLLMATLFFTRFSQENLLSVINVNASSSMAYNEIYKTQGALLGFFSVGMAGDVGAPERYSREYMESLAAIVIENADRYTGSDGRKPNVIVVMSEAFWDPTELPHVAFSDDPVPNLRRLKGETTFGDVIVPAFGGMTCNPEFEFLTGNAMRFTGFGDVPYYASDTYIDRDNGRSLPSMFQANGYHTVALHTYLASFFDRDKHYPKLGFDRFIAEEDMPNALTKGALNGNEIISDEYFGDLLIDILDNTEMPLFLFGITMQNHTPYLPHRYEATRIKADSAGLLSDDDTAYLETFLEGVYDADVLLGRLYDYVMESDDPTILLYFGDHLPALVRHTGIYSDLGFISDSELNDLPVNETYQMYSTPYVVISNYMELPETWGNVSPYFLGALLADAAGIELNYYHTFLLQAYESFQALSDNIFVMDEEVFGAPPENILALEMFEAFQYDKLFGNGYTDDLLSSFPSLPQVP